MFSFTMALAVAAALFWGTVPWHTLPHTAGGTAPTHHHRIVTPADSGGIMTG